MTCYTNVVAATHKLHDWWYANDYDTNLSDISHDNTCDDAWLSDTAGDTHEDVAQLDFTSGHAPCDSTWLGDPTGDNHADGTLIGGTLCDQQRDDTWLDIPPAARHSDNTLFSDTVVMHIVITHNLMIPRVLLTETQPGSVIAPLITTG